MMNLSEWMQNVVRIILWLMEALQNVIQMGMHFAVQSGDFVEAQTVIVNVKNVSILEIKLY